MHWVGGFQRNSDTASLFYTSRTRIHEWLLSIGRGLCLCTLQQCWAFFPLVLLNFFLAMRSHENGVDLSQLILNGKFEGLRDELQVGVIGYDYSGNAWQKKRKKRHTSTRICIDNYTLKVERQFKPSEYVCYYLLFVNKKTGFCGTAGPSTEDHCYASLEAVYNYAVPHPPPTHI